LLADQANRNLGISALVRCRARHLSHPAGRV
jgi:hypothetical protein